MKLFHLLILMTVLFSYSILAQTYEAEDFDSQDEERLIAGQDLDTELLPPELDEHSSTEEIQQQEDILYPEGEDSSWSLGSEELSAEDYE